MDPASVFPYLEAMFRGLGRFAIRRSGMRCGGSIIISVKIDAINDAAVAAEKVTSVEHDSLTGFWRARAARDAVNCRDPCRQPRCHLLRSSQPGAAEMRSRS